MNYDDKTLKKLQRVELGILKDFEHLCKKYNLDYFLGGGSAIGAIRHQGFIPWDDDIDVNMTRKDYNQFLEIAKNEKEYLQKYKVVNNETDPNFPLMHTHWILKGTKFITEDFKHIDADLGIFLDIFCFDNVPDDDKLMKKQGTRAWLLGKFVILCGVKKPVIYIRGIKAKIILAISFIVHNTFKLFRLKPSFFYKKAKKEALKYNHTTTKRMAYMFDPQRFTSILSKDEIFPTKKVMFDGVETRVANQVEVYLTKRFGNYMELPPVDKRHNHCPYILDFGDNDNKQRSPL